ADLGAAGPDPFARAEQDEALDRALDLLLAQLNATERAAYILRIAFDYPYTEIADSLRLSPANTRQIVSRARRRLTTAELVPASPAGHGRLTQAFATAARDGDLTGLTNILARDTARSRARSGKRRAGPGPGRTL
ncbi:MAG: RNA polymerase subunit sigma-24, partial [Kitasatospora sp.]|nr:RNA polymerase subunit sigma-24 [Kitasatospora sp.]